MKLDDLLAVVAGRPDDFRSDFPGWLAENLHIYMEFEHRALQIARFRKHYSARTIVEVMRHDSLIAEKGGAYKINGNWVPDMALLSMLTNNALRDFFHIRRERCGDRVAA